MDNPETWQQWAHKNLLDMSSLKLINHIEHGL